jgi:hypothetical protein
VIGLGVETVAESYTLFGPDVVFEERDRDEPVTFEGQPLQPAAPAPLTDYEIAQLQLLQAQQQYQSEEDALALRRLQEQVAAIQAYAMLATHLGLPTDAPIEDLGAALNAKGLTVEEVTNWLPACDYEVQPCFHQTMLHEFYLAEQRKEAVKAQLILGGSLIGVLALAVVAWRRRG